MERMPAFQQWLYKFRAPESVIALAQEVALMVPYRVNSKNLTSDDFSSRHLPQMIPVRNWVDQCLNKVSEDLGFECDDVKSTIEWFNRAEKGMWHPPHTHHNSFLSGILYLTPSDAQTWFSVPSVFGPDYTLLNLIHPDNHFIYYKHQTTVGDMLVFPSGMLHSVNEHTLEKPRYTMAFNAFPSGFIGTQSDKVYRKFMNITVNQEK
jgi:hypothetical protein